MEQKEKATLNSTLTSAIVKSRFVIIVVLLALILVAIGVGIAMSIKNNNIEAGLSQLDSIEFRYDSLNRSSDTYAEEQEKIISEVENFVNSESGIVKVRGLLFSADILFELEKWADARDAYIGAYEASKSSYTAPVALYNAAVACEELGEIDTAVEYLTQAIEFENFSLKPRAIFSLGRIEETRGNFSVAVEKYQELNDNYPSTTWTSLAKSRIIALETEGKVDAE